MIYVLAVWVVFAVYFLGMRDGQCNRPFSIPRFFVRMCLALLWPFVLLYGLYVQDKLNDNRR